MKNNYYLVREDALEFLSVVPDNAVDLIFCSPPYEAARAYEGDVKALRREDWVKWAFDIWIECDRVSKGLVAWVVEGRTKNFQYIVTPLLLAADLHRAGIKLRKPPIYHRVGIPGSGGPDWLRNDYEFIICSSKGRLPWSDNTATGKPPVYDVGGPMSNRGPGDKRVETGFYTMPKIANPGNVIKCSVGGGHMGSSLAHINEAPFPESLADVFVKSFCPPDGLVMDIFCGSGTTLVSALKNGRNAIGVDIRQSQIDLTRTRIEQEIEQ